MLRHQTITKPARDSPATPLIGARCRELSGGLADEVRKFRTGHVGCGKYNVVAVLPIVSFISCINSNPLQAVYKRVDFWGLCIT